jgi:uncharacterized membrane protein YgcG
MVLLSDTVWNRLACRAFLFRKSWFLFTLVMFIAGQSVLKHWREGDKTYIERIMVFVLRVFIYCFSMVQLIFSHNKKICKGYRAKDTFKLGGCISIPKYLTSWQEGAGFGLMSVLVLMLLFEPIIWCLSDNGGNQFTEVCDASKDVKFAYSVFSMLAMFLYFSLLLDLAVLSTKVSAYVLVCIRMISEVALFILALVAVMLAFSSAISVIKHDQADFAGIHKGLLTLLETTMKMYDGEHFEAYEGDSLVLICVFVFIIIVAVFLTNMLVAQLTCAYEAVYVDMVGYARLERVQIIVNTMPSVSEKRWVWFKGVLRLDQKTEFNAGDLGVSGGIQIQEPANANPTTQDIIKRYGGSTSPEMQWPDDQEGEGDETERFERIEALIGKTMKRLTKEGGGDRKGKAGSSGGHSGSNNEDGEGAASGSEGEGGDA